MFQEWLFSIVAFYLSFDVFVIHVFCFSTSSEDAENEMTKQDVEKVEALMKALQAAKEQVSELFYMYIPVK